MGSLLPVDGESPKFAQLYVFDTAHEVANRLFPFTRDSKSSSLDENIVVDLLRILMKQTSLPNYFAKLETKLKISNLLIINFAYLESETMIHANMMILHQMTLVD